MRVVLIGRYVVAFPFCQHTVDYGVLRAWADQFSRLHVVVQGTDRQWRRWRARNLVVHYAPLRSRGLGKLGFLIAAARLVVAIGKRRRIDVVNGSDLWGSLVGLWARRRLGVKVIAQLQGQFLPPSRAVYGPVRRVVVGRLARIVVRRADLVRCLYQDSAERVKGLGVPPERLAVVPSRCDIALFNPARFESRDRSGEQLLYVGNLHRGKGVAVLLNAVARLALVWPGLELVVVGSGPEERRLRELAGGLAIGSRVNFLGRRPQEELPALYARCRALVLPSFSEATPRVVLEAMAMRVPVVGTRVGGVPDLVVQGQTGLLVEPGNVRELAAAIEFVLTNPNWAAEAGRLGQERVKAFYTSAHQVDRMVSLHYRVCGSARNFAGNLGDKRRAPAGCQAALFELGEADLNDEPSAR